MKKIRLTYWDKRKLEEMSKDELIEAIIDAYHLYREANQRNTQNMIRLAHGFVEANKHKSFIGRLLWG